MGRREEGDTQAAGVCKGETGRKEASVRKSAGGVGGRPWLLCRLWFLELQNPLGLPV